MRKYQIRVSAVFKKISATFIFFLYYYTLSFWFLPFSTTVIMGIFGLLMFVILNVNYINKLKIDKHVFVLLVFLSSIGLVSIFSLLINNSSDIKFIKYVFSQLAIFSSSYFVLSVLSKLNYQLDFDVILRLIINVTFIQSLIAVFMVLMPNLRDLLLGLEDLSQDQLDRIESLSSLRLYGLGSSKTFLAGVFNGYALILISLMFRLYSLSTKEIVGMSLKFFMIFLIGVLMARTTLLGALIALVIIFMPRDKKLSISLIRRRSLFFLISFILPFIIIVLLILYSSTFNSYFGSSLRVGFELFVNFLSRGEFTTDSTSELISMFVFPDNIMTYMFGDGYFDDPLKFGSYYKSTDVGYLRLIYYFGILGLFCFLTFQIYSIKISYDFFDIGVDMYIWIIVYFLILNLKGFTDLFSIHAIFVMLFILRKKDLNKKTPAIATDG